MNGPVDRQEKITRLVEALWDALDEQAQREGYGAPYVDRGFSVIDGTIDDVGLAERLLCAIEENK